MLVLYFAGGGFLLVPCSPSVRLGCFWHDAHFTAGVLASGMNVGFSGYLSIILE